MNEGHAASMLNAGRLTKRFNVAVLRRGFCWLLIALALAATVPPADAAGPGLLHYFRACGIGDDAFARFADDRQVADEEFDVIRRIAVRCATARQIGCGALPPGAGRLPSPAEAKGQRGRMFELQGSLASVESVEGQEGEPLWRCTLALSEYPHRAVIYAAEVPARLLSGGSGQRVAVDGVFVKYVPGAAVEPMVVLVAPRLNWRPESPLGDLGMDFGLFQGIQDGSALTAADREAFYRLLLLAKNADPARLARDAARLDASPQRLPALFGDPAAQRGRLVKLSGTARRVVRVPIDDPAIVSRLGADHYFEIDLVAEGSQNNPLVFCTLDLPGGMPLGGPPSYLENVEVTGFFLKTWQYPTALSEEEKEAKPGSSRELQTAPLVIGTAPLWNPAAVVKKSPNAAAVGGFLALAMLAVCLLLWHFRQTDQEFSRHVIARE